MTNQTMLKEIFEPIRCREQFDVDGDPWIYRYEHPEKPWVLSIATYGHPQSGSLSLGGFRIAPASRTDLPNYNNNREALGLATGMEGKVFWSRLLGLGGPLGKKEVHRIVGGKCVLLPTPAARMGQSEDFDLLNFATDCLAHFEASTGIHITTGQDLGHGVMSDGATASLDYLHSKFAGSIRANTAGPTGEGNYKLLKGMLHGLGIQPQQARVGLIGCGNVGGHVLKQLHRDGFSVFGLEAYAPKRELFKQEFGVEMWEPEQKDRFLQQPMDALVVNASGSSLNSQAIDLILQNPRLRIVCGCENLAMPNKDDALRLADAGTLFAPTQLGGMFGYLTAVEEYLCAKIGREFNEQSLIEAAAAMEDVGEKGAKHVAQHPKIPFETALKTLYS